MVNWDKDEDHTVDVRVERDGSAIHESIHTVRKMERNQAQAAIIDCTWDDVAGEYLVFARTDGNNDWRKFNLLEAADQSPDCVVTAVQYGKLGGIAEERPLNVEVRNRCDEIGENYEEGCPAHL